MMEILRRFGRTYCLHYQGRKVSQASYQQEEGTKYSFLHHAIKKYRGAEVWLHIFITLALNGGE
jgi:hypothetical protein